MNIKPFFRRVISKTASSAFREELFERNFRVMDELPIEKRGLVDVIDILNKEKK